MAPFAGCFTRPTWANLPVLAAGAVLAPGRRTVAAIERLAAVRRPVGVITRLRLDARW